ncbi:MAG: ankyrin repeat domain-containing protein [Leadbetterella sp.]|nr:ankyrin repeat domain-containing protein [Leadbetterella sp.]
MESDGPETMLLTSCIEGNEEYIKSYRSKEFLKDIKDEAGRNLLIIAAYHHHYALVEFLLENEGFDVNSVNSKGTSVLMYAKTKTLENKNYQFLDYLIQKGANIYHRDNLGKDIFYYTDKLGNEELLAFLNQYKWKER